MMPEIQKHSNRPRIIPEVPGWWALPKDMRELVTRRMKARADERDGKSKKEGEKK
jgi:hypothetical protein